MEQWQEQFYRDCVVPFEGYSETMYLDSIGLVTVDRGCQISLAEAVTLGFTSLTGIKSTEDQIAREYNRISQLAKNHLPSFYRNSNSPILPKADGLALVTKRITSATKNLISLFPQFNSWPVSAKVATLEMPWALKDFAHFRKNWPIFCNCLDNEDWNCAAHNCAWNDPSGLYKLRNAKRMVLYLQAENPNS